MIEVRRVYGEKQRRGGYRILVDRVWPRRQGNPVQQCRCPKRIYGVRNKARKTVAQGKGQLGGLAGRCRGFIFSSCPLALLYNFYTSLPRFKNRKSGRFSGVENQAGAHWTLKK